MITKPSGSVTGKPRVVSGMRPTGKLHLGHLVGALKNWSSLQESYDCFYFVADWHALTSDYANTS
jgi:tryptophanyl-tRNA synthetase